MDEIAIQLGEVRTNRDGFERILDAVNAMQDGCDVDYVLDMSHLSWLDANMCAPLGALLRAKVANGVQIGIVDPPGEAGRIMMKNGFLASFGRPVIRDSHDTTIRYQPFDIDQAGSRAFQAYVTEHFRPGVKGLPEMTPALLTRFTNSLFEIYENAQEHSETRYGVYACGQYYPKKQRLDFTIADLGMGIAESIRRKGGVVSEPEDAIQWAVSWKTTRIDSRRPGGLGLQLLREFIGLNQGKLMIVSDAGYWCSSPSGVYRQHMTAQFPGTVVTVEINTADTQSYGLTSEIDRGSIF